MKEFSDRLHQEAVATFLQEPPPHPDWVNESIETKRARQDQWVCETTLRECAEAIEFARFIAWASRAREAVTI